MTGFRLDNGGRIDRSRRLGFTYDGHQLEGHPGDTLGIAKLFVQFDRAIPSG